jgi:hypothetical protein
VNYELRSLKEFQQAVQQAPMQERVAAMAPFIRSNAHLRRIIKKIPIKQREAVYNALKAYLRFTPQSFAMLKPR